MFKLRTSHKLNVVLDSNPASELAILAILYTTIDGAFIHDFRLLENDFFFDSFNS